MGTGDLVQTPLLQENLQLAGLFFDIPTARLTPNRLDHVPASGGTEAAFGSRGRIPGFMPG
jgi:hypothetical protein